MKKYRVIIEHAIVYEVFVNAEDEEQAEQIANHKYIHGELNDVEGDTLEYDVTAYDRQTWNDTYQRDFEHGNIKEF